MKGKIIAYFFLRVLPVLSNLLKLYLCHLIQKALCTMKGLSVDGLCTSNPFAVIVTEYNW